jgi:hypothetical protein
VDFGTSNTAAAYRVGAGPVQPVRLSDQAEQVPSAVLALDTGITVGGAAVRSARLDPQRFEPTPKRRIGEGEILLGPREWPVPQLIAAVLGHVAQKARWVAGGEPPRQLVLTYPQQWAQGRKHLLVRAAAQAGFDPATVVLVTEPVAAATWYAATEPVPPGKCVAVFDFGGGTCDVAVLRAEPGQPGNFTVLAADGVDPLGGELLDLRLLEWTLGQLADGGHGDLVDALAAPENLGAMITLKEQVRHAKHELSEYESARIPVAVGSSQTVVTVTSAEFDRLVGPDIDEAVALTRRALIASGQTPAELHALYLTGGSSHLRLVHRKLTELIGRPPATLNDPKLVVAMGALLAPAAAREATVGQPPMSTGQPSGPVPVPTPAPAPPTGPTVRPGITGAPLGSAGFPGSTPVGAGTGPPAPTTVPGRTPVAPGSPPMPPGRPVAAGPQQAPSGRPNGAPGPGRPRWLIPAAAALVVVLLAGIAAFLGTRGSADDQATDDTTTTSVTTTPTTGESAGAATGDGRVQRCPNGTTVPADDTCPTDRPVTCWDDSSAPRPQDCPALEGQKALEWIFPAPAEWSRDCKPYTDDTFAGEAEVYRCTVEQLEQTTIFLSRWDDPATAHAQFTANSGEPAEFRLEGDGDDASALEWTRQGDLDENAATTDEVVEKAVVYKDEPYSMLVYFGDPGGVAVESEKAWVDGALFQAPTSIAERGATS